MIMETLSRYFLVFLLNSLWQIPLIAGVAMLACRLMRKGPAGHRHAMWVAALLAAALLPFASVRSGEHTSGSAFSAPSAPQLSVSKPSPAVPAGVVSSFPAPAHRTISYAQTTATALFVLYLLFLVFRFARLSRAWIRTVAICDGAGHAEEPVIVRRVWDRCLEALGPRNVELRSSPNLSSPVAAGLWRTTVILPERLFSCTDEDVLTTAIGHEMAHLARHDFALNIFYEILSLPVAFHPAFWLIRWGAEETREMACDELVTRKLLDASVYARSIVTIAAEMTALSQPGYMLGIFDRDILEERIRRLLDRPRVNLKRARLLLAGGLGAVALCAILASGVAVTARAQIGDLDSKVRALEPLMSELRQKPADAQLMGRARQALREILAIESANQHGLNGMMNLSLYAKQPLEARQWALKMVAQYPKEKTAYYCAGLTDWAAAYPAVTAARAGAGMKPQDEGFIADAGTRRALREQYGSLINEGLRMLGTALQMDPRFSGAMAYMNLLYRLQANVVESAPESAAALAKADEWVANAITASKQEQPAVSPASDTPFGVLQPSPPPPPPPSVLPQPPSDAAPVSDAPVGSPNFLLQPGTYWQVKGNGETPAKALIAQLKAQNFAAHWVFTGSGGNALVRVMIGPFADDVSLAEARSRLEAAGFRVIRTWR